MAQIIYKAASLAAASYLTALVLTRLLGRKMISQMTFFDFVVGVMFGSAAVNAAVVSQNPSVSGFVILIVISLLTLIIDFAHIKSFLVRKAANSEPVTVIENGRIVQENMKRVRLSVEELMMKLRDKNVFNIADVEFAMLEIDGKLSVLPKSQKQPLTPSDVNIPTPYKGLPRDLIIDGEVLKENLAYINQNQEWLKDRLKGYGVRDISDVFYTGLDSSGNLYVSKKQTSGEEHGKYGLE